MMPCMSQHITLKMEVCERDEITKEQAIIRLRHIGNNLSKYCDVNDCICGNCAKCYAALDMAEEALQAEAEWILCSERLPRPDEEVFVYLWGDVPYLASVNDEGQWKTDNFYLDADDSPKVWMPLPKPYREDSEG